MVLINLLNAISALFQLPKTILIVLDNNNTVLTQSFPAFHCQTANYTCAL